MSGTGFYGSDISPLGPRALLEALGTFFLVFIGTKAVTDAATGSAVAGSPIGSTGVALAFGVVGILVYALGPRTGCHLNPAISLAAWLSGKITAIELVCYSGAQVAGACAASFLLKATLPDASIMQAKLGLTTLAHGYGDWSLFAYEALGTGLLVFVVLFAAVSGRVPEAASGIAVGGALVFGVLITGSVTGGALNPARLLGPMFAMGVYTNWWIYILAEFSGAVLAWLLYNQYGSVRPSD